ncbi:MULTISPECIES: pseudouridine synthase [unclassified Meiothermus]|uniref:pseudouridine synthase n=1 Tax=unclassified Meiothermus TaxID=370471 RepID=UPI000D7C76C1|nr:MULTISPECIES: pseudouridine synthase [unclassified Meiothermus]PZA07083.1 RNA-binding protein [Meiothermus sp. Pnk-1]RYM40037.1 rRNA pseudouridine synthase [Meiothermus sp. PNK-Is4]
MRLQQFLARAGVASRRKAEDLIRAGRVTINDRVAKIGSSVSDSDVVRLDGERVRLPEKKVVIALHKPVGVTTTKRDPHAERTVYQLVPDVPGLHPVGRLDKDSEGLLLLTNDGELTLKLTHPRYGVRKVYRVWCKQGRVPEADCQRLVEGVELEDGLAQALEAEPTPEGARIVMAEGKKREVRRMLRRLGYAVTRLVRWQVGPIKLGKLNPGEWRYLTPEEINVLHGRAPAKPRRVQIQSAQFGLQALVEAPTKAPRHRRGKQVKPDRGPESIHPQPTALRGSERPPTAKTSLRDARQRGAFAPQKRRSKKPRVV